MIRTFTKRWYDWRGHTLEPKWKVTGESGGVVTVDDGAVKESFTTDPAVRENIRRQQQQCRGCGDAPLEDVAAGVE